MRSRLPHTSSKPRLVLACMPERVLVDQLIQLIREGDLTHFWRNLRIEDYFWQHCNCGVLGKYWEIIQ